MSSDYNYDDQAQFFPFFILTITGLVTLPLTYSLLKPSKDLENTASRIKSPDFTPEEENLITAQKKAQWRKERKTKRFVTVLIGLSIMAYMIYLIVVTQRIIPQIWDPYSVLQIGRSATEKAIKKQYRKLSLKYHPDKARPIGNQTMDDINSIYVDITKAYKALTDEDTRRNWLEFGHPDGKQSFSIGIALPKLMVEEGMGTYVLLVYGVLLGVLLPYVVGRWWYGTQRVTKDGVLVASAGKLFQQYKDDITEGGILSALSHGVEYEDVLKGNQIDQGLGRVEKVVMQDQITGPSKKDYDRFQLLEGVPRKINALLWAYLTRTKFEDAALDSEKYAVVAIALRLCNSFISMCLAYAHTQPIINAYKICQHIIQATTPGSSPLLQLPYFTPAIARSVEGQNSKKHITIQEFMELPEYERRNLLTNSPDGLDPKQYNAAMNVARQIPVMHVETAFFKCRGEKAVVAHSLVQLVVKARLVPLGSSNIPPPDPEDLLDIDPDETGEEETNPKRRKSGKARGLQAVDTTEIDRPHSAPLAYAPYYPRDHPVRWNLFLAQLGDQGRVVVPPSTFTTFDQPVYDAEGNPTFAVQTFKLQFPAPPNVGQYSFTMHFVNDSYIGLDIKQEVTLTVEDQSQLEEIESDEEISEPDEDTIAGQMSALKSGGLSGPTKPKKKKAAAAKSEDSDESATEEEDDDSSTDTETEDEA